MFPFQRISCERFPKPFLPEDCLWYKSDNLHAIPQRITSATSDAAFLISFTSKCLDASGDSSNLLLKVFHSKAFVSRILLLSHTQFWLAIRRLQIWTSEKGSLSKKIYFTFPFHLPRIFFAVVALFAVPLYPTLRLPLPCYFKIS